MPRPKADEPRREQLLLRLTRRQLDVLEAVAHLERTSPNRYAHQVLVDHLAQTLRNPRVQADLANRHAYSEDRAVTTELSRRRGTTNPGDESENVERQGG